MPRCTRRCIDRLSAKPHDAAHDTLSPTAHTVRIVCLAEMAGHGAVATALRRRDGADVQRRRLRGARGHAQHPLARHRRDASAFAPLRAVPVAAVPSLQPWSLALLMIGVSLLATRTRRRSAG